MSFAHSVCAASRRLLCCTVLALFFAPATASAQIPEDVLRLQNTWHEAGVADYRGDWPKAVALYTQAISQTETMPLHTREWYKGTAAYAIARCAARAGDATLARSATVFAMQHHFWSIDLPMTDTPLRSLIGSSTLDSLHRFWSAVREREVRSWHDQPTIVIEPKSPLTEGRRRNLVIALHGGNANYEEFAERFRELADKLNAVIVVPAGVERVTEVTNSWGLKAAGFEPTLMSLIAKYQSREDVDPSHVFVTGFSQGGHAAIQLALRHSDVVRGAIAIASFIGDTVDKAGLVNAKKSGVRIYCLTGAMEDAVLRASIDRAAAETAALGIHLHLEIVPTMIHEVPVNLEELFMPAWKWVNNRDRASNTN